MIIFQLIKALRRPKDLRLATVLIYDRPAELIEKVFLVYVMLQAAQLQFARSAKSFRQFSQI